MIVEEQNTLQDTDIPFYDNDDDIITDTDNDIEIIESQVAFLQSLFLPVIFILFLSIIPSVDLSRPLNLQTGFCDCRCMYVLSIWTGSIITIILMAILMISRQRIIYKRVWEDYHYLRKIRDNLN